MQFLVSIMLLIYHFLQRSRVLQLILHNINIFIEVDDFILIWKYFGFVVVTNCDDWIEEIMHKFDYIVLHFEHPELRKHKEGFFFLHPLGFIKNLFYSFFSFIR